MALSHILSRFIPHALALTALFAKFPGLGSTCKRSMQPTAQVPYPSAGLRCMGLPVVQLQ